MFDSDAARNAGRTLSKHLTGVKPALVRADMAWVFRTSARLDFNGAPPAPVLQQQVNWNEGSRRERAHAEFQFSASHRS